MYLMQKEMPEEKEEANDNSAQQEGSSLLNLVGNNDAPVQEGSSLLEVLEKGDRN